MITSFLPKSQNWKRVWILEVWSENGRGKLHILVWNKAQDLENRAAHPHQEFSGVPPDSFFVQNSTNSGVINKRCHLARFDTGKILWLE